jgi:hypothetical protein
MRSTACNARRPPSNTFPSNTVSIELIDHRSRPPYTNPRKIPSYSTKPAGRPGF